MILDIYVMIMQYLSQEFAVNFLLICPTFYSNQQLISRGLKITSKVIFTNMFQNCSKYHSSSIFYSQSTQIQQIYRCLPEKFLDCVVTAVFYNSNDLYKQHYSLLGEDEQQYINLLSSKFQGKIKSIKSIDIEFEIFENVFKVPKKLESVEFKEDYQILLLSDSVTKLVLSDNHSSCPQKLPPYLTHLTFGHTFNSSVENYLPKTLTHLTFGENFNVFVEDYPHSLTHLTFGTAFNQDVNNLPDSLIFLTFGRNFDRFITKLPVSLTFLEFGMHFDHSITNYPKGLKVLKFGQSYNKPLTNLPSSLEKLRLNSRFNSVINPIPENLTHLVCGRSFDQVLSRLPQNLVYLGLFYHYCQELPVLPSTLLVLQFYYYFEEVLEDISEYKNLPINNDINLSLLHKPIKVVVGEKVFKIIVSDNSDGMMI